MDHTTIIQRESTICKHDFKSSCKETFVEVLYLPSTFNGHVSEQRADKAKDKEQQIANTSLTSLTVSFKVMMLIRLI